jgi:hypothetical protein
VPRRVLVLALAGPQALPMYTNCKPQGLVLLASKKGKKCLYRKHGERAKRPRSSRRAWRRAPSPACRPRLRAAPAGQPRAAEPPRHEILHTAMRRPRCLHCYLSAGLYARENYQDRRSAHIRWAGAGPTPTPLWTRIGRWWGRRPGGDSSCARVQGTRDSKQARAFQGLVCTVDEGRRARSSSRGRCGARGAGR